MWKVPLGLVLCLLITGCQHLLPTGEIQPTDQSELTITASFMGLDHNEQWRAQLLFTRGRHSFQQEIPITGDALSFNLGIPIGTWQIELVILDADDSALFQDTIPEMTIYPNSPSTISMNLLPASGVLHIALYLEDYPQQAEVLRSRIHINDTVTELIRDELSEPLIAEIQLPPGDYDLKIELFTGSFRATDKIHEGVWQSITIEPSMAQQITWNPEMEQIEIIAVIGIIPQAPATLSGEFIGEDTVELTWSPSPSENIAGYMLYCQLNPFARFISVNETPLNGYSYTHHLPLERTSRLSYVVAAVSHHGLVGYRSAVITLQQ